MSQNRTSGASGERKYQTAQPTHLHGNLFRLGTVLRARTRGLFIAQSDHRVDARGSPRGNPASDSGHASQDD